MSFEEIYQQVDRVEGWMGEADCRKLYEYVKSVKGLIVEIGSYMGRSTRLLALSSPESEVIAVDPFKDNKFFAHPPEEVLEGFNDATRGLNVKLIRAMSTKANKGWDRGIDFLFIDGDHSYKAVKNDIKLWVPFVKRGHYVFFHDYYGRKPEEEYIASRHAVSRAVDEYSHLFDEVLTSPTDFGFAICRKK